MSESKESILKEVNEKRNQLSENYQKLQTKDFKHTHLISSLKKDIARLYTKLNTVR